MYFFSVKGTKHNDILPSSSSIVLPPTVSLTPNTLLNKMEKALPHTPNALEILQVSLFIDI